jgi:hypothetical protein
MFEFNLTPSFRAILCMLFLVCCVPAWAGHATLQCTSCHDPVAEPASLFSSEGRGYDRSLFCLSCHDARMDTSGLNPPHVIDGLVELAGGSFTSIRLSDKTGHNIQSVDTTLGNTPPGGVRQEELSCLSCHDPHDNGNFRNLKKEINGRPTPVRALADPAYQDNVYISGMSQFCGACHSQFYGDRNIRNLQGYIRHPVEIPIAGAPNADLIHWSGLQRRVTRVEIPTGDPNHVETARVFCLSCHRAHATLYADALRWDYAGGSDGCLECHPF